MKTLVLSVPSNTIQPSTFSWQSVTTTPLSHILGRNRFAATPQANTTHSGERKEDADRRQH